jgi:hypothetical protein
VTALGLAFACAVAAAAASAAEVPCLSGTSVTYKGIRQITTCNGHAQVSDGHLVYRFSHVACVWTPAGISVEAQRGKLDLRVGAGDVAEPPLPAPLRDGVAYSHDPKLGATAFNPLLGESDVWLWLFAPEIASTGQNPDHAVVTLSHHHHVGRFQSHLYHSNNLLAPKPSLVRGTFTC